MHRCINNPPLDASNSTNILYRKLDRNLQLLCFWLTDFLQLWELGNLYN